jgi:hypothetical protein
MNAEKCHSTPQQSTGSHKRGRKSIQNQLSGMGRGLRQATNGRDYILAPQTLRLAQRFAHNQLRNCRATGDGCDASFSLELHRNNSPGGRLERKPQYIATSGVLDFRRGIGIGYFSYVARILKMIEQLCGIHEPDNCKRRSRFAFTPATPHPRENKSASLVHGPWLPDPGLD